jgi:lipopolysaccharide/colanic/teichoic acid biosynthesis glycosyltransferase
MTKRLFDIVFSVLALLILAPFLLIAFVIAAIDTGSNGLFCQQRIGQYGKPFTIFKLRSMHIETGKVSATGKFFRKYKIDELPQLLNVLLGCMTFVGPRPDISGYYDVLQGEDRKVLELKPGITSMASLKYYNEEELLEQHNNPLYYNDTVIFPDKVKMNLEYYYNRNFWIDLKILWKTFFR